MFHIVNGELKHGKLNKLKLYLSLRFWFFKHLKIAFQLFQTIKKAKQSKAKDHQQAKDHSYYYNQTFGQGNHSKQLF